MTWPWAKICAAALALIASLWAAGGARAQAPPQDPPQQDPPQQDPPQQDPPQQDPPQQDPPQQDPPQQDPPHIAEANQRLETGERLFQQGDYDGALAEYQRAYELVGDHPARALVLFNIARAHERRFRYDLALSFYQRYLEEAGPGAPRTDRVRTAMETLRGLLATVHVQVDVPHAEVWIEDRQVGEAPGDVYVTGGRHVLEVRAAGHEPVRREIQIASRTEQTLELSLSELAGEFRGVDPIFFGVAVGAAVAAGLAGAGLGGAVVARRDDVDQRWADPVLRTTVGESDREEIRTLALAADILFGTAGLFAATALALAFLTDWGGGDDETQGGSAARPLLFGGPEGGGAGLEVRW